MKLVEQDAYTGPRATSLGCPSPDVLLALGGDALPDVIRQPVDAHLARCAACRVFLADLSQIELAVPASLDRRVLDATRSGGSAWRTIFLPMAAVLVLALGVGLYYRALRSPVADTTVATAPVPASTAAAPQRGTWDTGKPALLLPLATAVVVRGEEAEAAAALGAALAPYRADDYLAAERQLEDVVTRFPESADAWFYLGATRLLDGDPAGAREALTRARALGAGDRDDEAAWLLATAEARVGALDEARSLLRSLCDTPGAFKTPACSALATLRRIGTE
jgi:tetratricopeptide (TPR) repeat protein